MAGIIRITPERVREVARGVDSIAQNAQQEVQQLQQRIESLQSEWEGMAKEKFFGNYQQAKKSMSTFIELLKDISNQLKATAERIEQADRAAR